MIELDGTFGEGGGQILRSSLALSLLTGCSSVEAGSPKADSSLPSAKVTLSPVDGTKDVGPRPANGTATIVSYRNTEVVLAIDANGPGFAVPKGNPFVGRADALIEGFRPGVMERLGIGPEPAQTSLDRADQVMPRRTDIVRAGAGAEGCLGGNVA